MLAKLVPLVLVQMETVAAAEGTETGWKHMMTVNPSDGSITWQFTSHYLYFGGYGFLDDNKDYIDDVIRHTPMDKIKITSTNSKNKTVDREQ